MPDKPNIGSFQRMKSLNRSSILNTIREQGPISRAEVAQQTSLTPPTVSNIVKELLDSKIVIETEQGTSRGGRKPTMLTINAHNFYIIGLDVGPTNIKTILTDLDAHIITSSQTKIPANIDNEGLLALLKESIQRISDANPDKWESIIGIGVGMHGMVDVHRGISLYAPLLQLHDIPIKASLEEAFQMVVHVENDARVMALGESWFGNGNGVNAIVCINVGRGIGAGMMIDGQLFHGAHFISGEIGHMTIDIDGPKCSCGNYGCLQALAAGPEIATRAAKEAAIGKETVLRQMCEGDLEAISGETVYEAAQQGDALSREILSETGRYLGIGITNLLHTIDPERIIIGGGVAKSGDYILENIQKTVEQRALTASARETDVCLTKLGDNATAIGAVSLLLVALFSTKAAE